MLINYEITNESERLGYPFRYTIMDEMRVPINIPTLDEMHTWLRETHGIMIMIEPIGNTEDYPKFLHKIIDLTDVSSSIGRDIDMVSMTYKEIIANTEDTYYEALADGLFEALKNIDIGK